MKQWLALLKRDMVLVMMWGIFLGLLVHFKLYGIATFFGFLITNMGLLAIISRLLQITATLRGEDLRH